jgi:GntR family transcriptional repressor for pyruvate dehydrogenase complex
MTVTDTTIESIRDLIASGRLSPGQRLPSEPELAARLGVSRSSLREAIRALAQARVLDVRRGDGTYVSSLEPDLLLGGLGFVVDLMQDSTLLEVFEVRRMFEPVATALAAMRVTDEDIADLRQSLDAMRQASDVEELISLDFDFHARVIAVTGNATLCSLMNALATRSLRARIWRGIAEGGVRAFTLEQHARIVEALGARDPVLASAASTIHVSESEQWLRRMIAKGKGEKALGGTSAEPLPGGLPVGLTGPGHGEVG